MQPSDRELVERFTRLGDEDAFRQLFARHSGRLYALAVRLLGDRGADADDVVQETWIRAAARFSAFEWRAALTTWLSAIAINCARERLRLRARDRSDEMTDGAEALASYASPAAPVGQTIDLERAIARLPDGYRTVFVLHDVEGYTHEQIASQLEIDVGTSKSQLSRARRALRAHLGAPAPEGAIR